MPTFLKTPRMDPALAARVEASVTGRASTKTAATTGMRRFVGMARLVVLVAAVFTIYTALTAQQKLRHDVERRRSDLLDAVRAQAATLTSEDKGAVLRAESWLLRLARDYDGDHVDDALRSPGALDAVLARPTLYVRGRIEDFQSAEHIAAAADASPKDALLVCLVDPPRSRAEAVLLEKARSALAGGSATEERTTNVRRLHDALVGLPFLLPAWSEHVRAAEGEGELARLRRDFEKAPIERAKQAARADVLVVAADEAGSGPGPTELDGERPHDVRVAIVDLAAAKVLLRVRRRVDPSWISGAKRPIYASALDGCALALDVRDAASR